MSYLKQYIKIRSKEYPGALQAYMEEECTDVVRIAFDELYTKIDNDKPYSVAKDRVYELMDEVLEAIKISPTEYDED